MIDTIIFQVNNVNKYKLLYEAFYTLGKKKNTRTYAFVEKDSGEVKENIFETTVMFNDTGNILPFKHVSNINIPSSHYSVAYVLDDNSNTLQFNLAIPKYLFGTNIFQFINLYDQGFTSQYFLLMSFLRDFIRDHMPERPLYSDIEIVRVDLCYNQFFNNKSDALAYLEEQKKLTARYARSSKNMFRTYQTSLMYVTRRYSFKIYHKGTEFAAHDYKELQKQNPKVYDLGFLQRQADCILRYECSFRKSFFDYMIGQYFFDSSGRSDVYNHHPLYSFGRELASRSKMMYSRGNKKRSLLENWRGRAKNYVLESPFDCTKNFDVLFDSSLITFDVMLFTLLYDFFWKKVEEYQIDTCLNRAEVIDKINKYNGDVEVYNRLALPGQKKRKKTSTLLALALLASETKNLTETYKKGMIGKTTFYKLRKDLKMLGLGNSSDLAIPKPRTDYFDYRMYFSKFH